jgi:hypothetical protein
MYHGEVASRPGAEKYETALLWRRPALVRGAVCELRCTAEHLGEDFFELCLLAGDEPLSSEPFNDIEALLARAVELRVRVETRGGFP